MLMVGEKNIQGTHANQGEKSNKKKMGKNWKGSLKRDTPKAHGEMLKIIQIRDTQNK